MPHCTKCGAAVADNAGFCPSCGAPQSSSAAGSTAPAASSPPASAVTDAGLQENVAGLLCYALGWITGLIFFLIDKRPFVRFHAKQSIVVFGALNILHFAVAMIFGISFLTGGLGAASIGLLLSRLISLVTFVLWIVLMLKAYQGQKFRVPLAADLAESIFGKS
jgi:uncharacterized membrane protein